MPASRHTRNTIKADDTCQSISKSQKVATFYLMQANNLPEYCSQLPTAGSTLCIPQSCNLYTVAANDNCYGIVQVHNATFSVTQLISWNPNINRQCSNLNQLVGYQICVSFPGTPSVIATGSGSVTTPAAMAPTNLAPDTTTKLGNMATYSGYDRDRARASIKRDPCHQINAPSSCFVTTYRTAEPFTWPAVGPTKLATALLPNVTTTNNLPLAPGTSGSCGRFTWYWEYSHGKNHNTCGWVAWIHTINVTDFVAWNPSLSYNAANQSACVLSPGYRYCIEG
ncbi:hypothetical protein V8C37DRAFT_211447 [Trichoderma ceciliae]